jgi:hypothetical protein
VGIGFGSAGSSEAQALVKRDGGVIARGDHQQQRSCATQTRPAYDLIHQKAAYAPLAMCGSGPHGDKMGPRRVILIKEYTGDAAGDRVMIIIHGKKSRTAFPVPARSAFDPVGTGKLNRLNRMRWGNPAARAGGPI